MKYKKGILVIGISLAFVMSAYAQTVLSNKSRKSSPYPMPKKSIVAADAKKLAAISKKTMLKLSNAERKVKAMEQKCKQLIANQEKMIEELRILKIRASR